MKAGEITFCNFHVFSPPDSPCTAAEDGTFQGCKRKQQNEWVFPPPWNRLQKFTSENSRLIKITAFINGQDNPLAFCLYSAATHSWLNL